MRSGKGYVYRREHLDELQAQLTDRSCSQGDTGLPACEDNGTVSQWHENQRGTPT
jgi:hypothetical protein